MENSSSPYPTATQQCTCSMHPLQLYPTGGVRVQSSLDHNHKSFYLTYVQTSKIHQSLSPPPFSLCPRPQNCFLSDFLVLNFLFFQTLGVNFFFGTVHLVKSFQNPVHHFFLKIPISLPYFLSLFCRPQKVWHQSLLH